MVNSGISPHHPPTDAVLVDRSRHGDRDALEELLRRHQPRLYALCRRLTGNEDDARDATQEALITIVRRLDSFDGRSSFGTWAYRVATNACLDELRRRTRRASPTDLTEVLAVEGRSPGNLSPVGPDLSPDLAEALAARLDVDAALATLPADFRAAVVLRDILTLDYAEIAEVLGVPIGTVRSRIARGRRALARLLADTGNPPPEPERPTPT